MNAKVENYTVEQTETLVQGYVANPTKETVEALAKEIGKSVRSVIAKLAKEGVYQAKGKAEGKAKGVTKVDLVAKIAEKYGVEAKALASLEKATKEALVILVG